MGNIDYLEEFKKMRVDPFYFAQKCIFTQDQIDQVMPIKPFPADLEYLKLYFRIWMKERLIAVPKSRRMFLTWATLILYLHDTIFYQGKQNGTISKKESDADDLLERCVFMLDHIPKDALPPSLIPKWKKTYCKLDFEEIGSRMMAFPSGSDQLRAFAFSGIMADEAAFWPDAREMYSSTFPTIENKGRLTMISSPSPGFFQDLVFDTLDDRPVPEGADSSHKFPIEGVEIWKNPKNKFLVYQILYTANPEKRNSNYIEAIKSAMPISTFNREFMLVWESFDGKPVFQDFNRDVHSSKEKLHPQAGLPLVVGVDFGLTPSAVICQLQGSQMVVLDEIVEVNMGAERFSERLARHLSVHFPHYSNFKKNVLLFVDPAGFDRAQTDESRCVEYLASKGFSPMPGALRWEERRTAVETYLTGRTKESSNFILDATRCPMLFRGFDGGYQFSERAFEIEPSKVRPLKNEFSHIHDALQYALSGMIRKRRSIVVSIPKPEYAWSKVN